MKTKDSLAQIEEWICANTQDEGFGSVYERVSLGRLLNRLSKTLKIKTVLEYGVPFSKGYDNMVFIKNKCNVTVADPRVEKIKKSWPSKIKPKFAKIPFKGEGFDLVWNFALLQTDPDSIKEMIKKSKKYVLFFTPNIWNYGTPFHVAYHIVSRKKCTHAERGSIRLRRLGGLKKFAENNNLKVLEAGYIDMPPWPDTAFSIREVKENILGMKLPPKEKIKPLPGKQVLDKVNNTMFIENSRLPIKYFFAHHQYVLAEKK